MPKVKYAGTAINDLIVPALSLGQAEAFDELISNISPLDGETKTAYAKRLLPMVAVAVQRNYPDMTVEQIADALDFENFNLAVKAALALSDAPKTRGE